MEIKFQKKDDKLTCLIPRSTELNRGKYTIKNKKYVKRENYIEMILYLSRYSLCL